MENYLYQILLREGTTEYALFRQFDYGLHAFRPLAGDDRLGGLNAVPFPISVVFGDRDWMDTRGSAKIVMANKYFSQGLCNLYKLPNSGHQMAIDNPQALAEILIKDTQGTNRHILMPCAPTIRYLDDQGKDLQEHDWDKVLTEQQVPNTSWNRVEESESYR